MNPYVTATPAMRAIVAAHVLSFAAVITMFLYGRDSANALYFEQGSFVANVTLRALLAGGYAEVSYMAYQDTTEHHHTDAEKAGFWGIAVASGVLGVIMLLSFCPNMDYSGMVRSASVAGTLACLVGYVLLSLT